MFDYPITTEEELDEAFKISPWRNSTANDINWKDRIDIQAIAQRYTTHSISSTINLPKEISVSEVSKIYLSAYNSGLKGVTVYREGSRDGVLISATKKSDKVFTYVDSVKRPSTVEGIAFTTKSDLENAMIEFNEAVSLDPKNADAWYYRGNTYYNLYEVEKALADYDKALELNPDHVEALTNRGNARVYSGDIEGGCRDWKKARALGKKNLEHKIRFCK
jgi:ribonucleotide reductase alpha subunit